MIRSDDRVYYEKMRTRFVEIAEGAAQQAGVQVEIAISGGSTTMNENTTLAGLWMANALAYGVKDDGPDLRQHGRHECLVGRADHPPRPVDRAGRHARALDRIP